MPELPEVETIKRGLIPHLEQSIIQGVIIRQAQLRWPVPLNLSELLQQQKITALTRRGKYLLVEVSCGNLIIHLGMSGSLRILPASEPPRRHDHVDIILSEDKVLRYHDPRRFGAILMTQDNPLDHPLLRSLGREPLSRQFNAAYLKHATAGRKMAIKPLLMDSKRVAGIGNIYAAEALFLAKIHPLTPAASLNLQQCERLVTSIKQVLKSAIAQGGTSVKDFVNSEGKPGYFSQQLYVYGRAGLPCLLCGSPLQSFRLGQRSTVFCEGCQGANRSERRKKIIE